MDLKECETLSYCSLSQLSSLGWGSVMVIFWATSHLMLNSRAWPQYTQSYLKFFPLLHRQTVLGLRVDFLLQFYITVAFAVWRRGGEVVVASRRRACWRYSVQFSLLCRHHTVFTLSPDISVPDLSRPLLTSADYAWPRQASLDLSWPCLTLPDLAWPRLTRLTSPEFAWPCRPVPRAISLRRPAGQRSGEKLIWLGCPLLPFFSSRPHTYMSVSVN